MQTKILISSLVILSFAATSIADTIVAFGRSACNGSAGSTVQCDSSCHSFVGRHSVKFTGGGHCVGLYEGTGCTGLRRMLIMNANQCNNINTGAPENSFACLPSFCE